MKAVVYTQYGPPDVLHVAEVEKPTPKANEVLVRIHAVSVGYGDIFARNPKREDFNMPALFWPLVMMEFGAKKPKKRILGSEFTGVIESVGESVSLFKPGDAVLGYLASKMGACAEYICMAEDGVLTHKPVNLSHEEAVTLPYGGLMAMGLLDSAKIQRGQHVLILGASGKIGAAVLQIAKKEYGAKVTGVCGTSRVEMVRALGADEVIDYTRQDFAQSGQKYDLIVDILGKSSFSACRRVLTPNGRYLRVSFKMKQVWQMLWTSLFSRQKVVCALWGESQEKLLLVKEWIEAGKLKAVLDRCYPMEQAAAAHQHMESGDRTGSVVITLV